MFRLQVCPRRMRRFDPCRRGHHVSKRRETVTHWRGATSKMNGDLGCNMHRAARDSGTRYVQWQSCHVHSTFTQTWASEYQRCRCIWCFKRDHHFLVPGPNLAMQYFFLSLSCSFCTHFVFCEPGGIVDMTTGYKLEGLGIESEWRRDFPDLSRPVLGSTRRPIEWVPGHSQG
jgi:hypothetical protein